MIDATSRPRAALLLRRLASGRITNDDFDGEYPDASPDAGVRAVWQFGWSLYSDLTTYRLRGRRALRSEQRRIVARCVIFLHSGLEYEHPPFPRMRFWPTFAQVVTLGLWRSGQQSAERVWRDSIDWTVWPFRSKSDLANAAQSVRFSTVGPRVAAR